MGEYANEPKTGQPAEAACPPEYETKSQVARRLGVSQRTIDNLMARRLLPFVKLSPKIIRFPRVEVDNYLRRHLTIKARGQESGVPQ